MTTKLCKFITEKKIRKIFKASQSVAIPQSIILCLLMAHKAIILSSDARLFFLLVSAYVTSYIMHSSLTAQAYFFYIVRSDIIQFYCSHFMGDLSLNWTIITVLNRQYSGGCCAQNTGGFYEFASITFGFFIALSLDQLFWSS